MTINVLSPLQIWKGFEIQNVPDAEIINEREENERIFTEAYINGEDIGGEKVKIFVQIIRASGVVKAPLVVIARGLATGVGLETAKCLNESGFSVAYVDLSGVAENKEHYTIYPSAVEYANRADKSNLYKIESSVLDTCWYQWAKAFRYALKYFASLSYVSTIGAIASGEMANVLWQAAATDENLSASVFVLNSGWQGYGGTAKFSGEAEELFEDEKLACVAGLEAESYAQHVKCPTLTLTATNNKDYDCDRAYDTLSRICEDEYKAIYYTVGAAESVGADAFKNITLFFERFLACNNSIKLPHEVDIKCFMNEGKFIAEVTPDYYDIKSVSLYLSEGGLYSAKRSYKVLKSSSEEDGKFVFEYLPYCKSEIVTAFAKVVYNNKFKISSKMVGVKLKEESERTYPISVIYNSRIYGGESIFYAEKEEYSSELIDFDGINAPAVKNGPVGLMGVSCKGGIITFDCAKDFFKDKDDAILMFDAYIKEGGVVSAKLIVDYLGEKKEYVANINLKPASIWHNVKFIQANFKTAEGMPLKSYAKVDALVFYSQNECLINNALWL